MKVKLDYIVNSTYFLFDKGVVLVLHFLCGLCSDFVNYKHFYFILYKLYKTINFSYLIFFAFRFHDKR